MAHKTQPVWRKEWGGGGGGQTYGLFVLDRSGDLSPPLTSPVSLSQREASERLKSDIFEFNKMSAGGWGVICGVRSNKRGSKVGGGGVRIQKSL